MPSSYPPNYNPGPDYADGTYNDDAYNRQHEYHEYREYPPPSSAYNAYYRPVPSQTHTWQERYYSSSAYESAPSSSRTHVSQLYSQPPYRDIRPSSPPRAPRAERERDRARSRSATPPPIGSPTQDYLTLSLDPSDSLPEPTRKLLILDLNGSLLLRSPRPPYSARRPNSTVPAQRTVHSRPYLGVLRQYLFHEDTRRWLDVMVWSSAQPHNVDDMVQKSFGEDRRNLVTVWARNTLGLADNHYHRKVQTVKDLAKPWAALPSLLNLSASSDLPLRPTSPASSHSSIASSSPSSPPPPSSPLLSSPVAPSSQPLIVEANVPTIHSALTTLLLDDSPLKAVLQPYNHLCLPEYTSKRRNADLAIIQRQRDSEPCDGEKKRRRREKKARKMAARKMNDGEERDPARERDSESPSADSVLSQATAEDVAASEGEIDPTLLGIIGVLHAARLQSNVAGWIRNGGLWPINRETILVGSQAGNDAEQTAGEDGRSKMWFEDPETMAYWTDQGHRALEELGIPIEHGVER